ASNSMQDSAFEKVTESLNKALELDPKYGPAIALGAERDTVLAKLVLARANVSFREPPTDDAPADAADAWQKTIKIYQDKLAAIEKVLKDYLDANGAQPDVVEAFADLRQLQYDDVQMQSDAGQIRAADLRR